MLTADEAKSNIRFHLPPVTGKSFSRFVFPGFPVTGKALLVLLTWSMKTSPISTPDYITISQFSRNATQTERIQTVQFHKFSQSAIQTERIPTVQFWAADFQSMIYAHVAVCVCVCETAHMH